jgi:hypothetical protein
VEKLITRNRASSDSGNSDNFVPLIPSVSVVWPDDDYPENPHHYLTVRGWHSFECRHGNWDVDALARDFSNVIHSSECRSATDPPKPVEQQWKSFTFCPREGVIVMVQSPAKTICSVCVWASSPDIAKCEFVLLRDRYQQKPKRLREKTNFVVITAGHHGFLGTRAVEMASPLRRDADLTLHYGQEFNDWNVKFLMRLRQKRTGVTILRGEPGTGKTTYLRYLTHKLRRSHRFYYLPLSVYPILAAPAAVEFWMEQDEEFKKFKKIVILEDAESLLMQRATDNQEHVSNLLNISDGFLGEMLKLHIICTINCPLDKIDPAITRPGRLLAMREFVRLSPAQANELAAARNLSINPQDDYSLAELYNRHFEPRANPNVLGFSAKAAVS